jgi:threonine dehydrogenase-like Zn-dependent dehydrogenase
VAILGSGPIGLITAMVAAAYGADTVAITDKSSSKLGFAAQHCPRVQTMVVSPDDSPWQSSCSSSNLVGRRQSVSSTVLGSSRRSRRGCGL